MEVRERIFDGRSYSILLPPVTKAMAICNESAVLFGPLIGAVKTQVDSGGWQIMAMLLKSVDPSALDRLLMQVVQESKLTCDKVAICSPVTFDQHFDDKRSTLYPVCFWVLWECVKDFFGDWAALAQRVTEAVIKAAASTSPPDGQSTIG